MFSRWNKNRREADNLVAAAQIVATSSLTSLTDRFPILRNLVQARGVDLWDQVVTIAALAARISTLTEEKGRSLMKALQGSLTSWNSTAWRAYRDLLQFVERNTAGGIDHEVALGAWVIWNLKGSQPTQSELGLAPVVGSLLFGTMSITPSTAADDPNHVSNFKQDYGLFLATQGVTRDVEHFFYDFRLYELSVLGKGQYTTMVDLTVEGEVYAMSLDFDAMVLRKILQRSSDQVRNLVERELVEDPSTPRTIELSQPIQLSVVAKLGVKQTVAKEEFIPLVAQRLL
jgi:hypothetical protein